MRSSDTTRIAGWTLLAAIVAILVVRGVGSALSDLDDFQGYIEAGSQVLEGKDIYEPLRNTWPPVFSVLAVPLALLARVHPRLAAAVWLGLSLLVFYAVLALSTRLVYRRALSLSCRQPSRICVASAAIVVPLILATRTLIHNFGNLQINLFILLLVLAGALQVTRRRCFAGGMLIGAATAIKILPVFFLPYFVWKRWWSTLVGFAAGLLVLSLSPILVFGPAQWWSYVQRWPQVAGDLLGISPNQSIYGTVERLVGHLIATGSPAVRGLGSSGDVAVTLVFAISVIALALAFLFSARRGGHAVESPAVTVELAFVLTAIPLLAPMSHTAYYVFLLPAYVVLWRAAAALTRGSAIDGLARDSEREDEGSVDAYSLRPSARRWTRWLLAASFLLGSLGGTAIVGRTAAMSLKVLGAMTVAGLLTTAALLVVRYDFGRR